MIDSAPRRIDLKGWLMLAWIAWFGALYARMYLAAKGGLIVSLLGRIAGQVVGLGR